MSDSFFTHLLDVGEFKIDEDTGHALLFGEFVLLIPPHIIIRLQKKLMKRIGREETEEILVKLAKKQVEVGLQRYKKRLNIDKINKSQILKFTKNFFGLLGWGSLEIKNTSFDSKEFDIKIKNSILPIEFEKYFDEKSEEPIDFYLKGLCKGLFSALFGVEMKVKEIKCSATGDNFCEFVGKPKEC